MPMALRQRSLSSAILAVVSSVVMVSSFVEVTPTAGAKEGTSAAATERGCHSFLGGPQDLAPFRPGRGGGTTTASLTASGGGYRAFAPSVLRGAAKKTVAMNGRHTSKIRLVPL